MKKIFFESFMKKNAKNEWKNFRIEKLIKKKADK